MRKLINRIGKQRLLMLIGFGVGITAVLGILIVAGSQIIVVSYGLYLLF